MYWAEAIAEKTGDLEFAERFSVVAKALAENETKIIAELAAAQGKAVDIGGYYNPDNKLTSNAMRPSKTLNKIIDSV